MWELGSGLILHQMLSSKFKLYTKSSQVQTSIIFTNRGKTGFLWTGNKGTSGNTSGTKTWASTPWEGSILAPALSSITASAPSSFLSPPSPSSLPFPLAPSEDWPLWRKTFSFLWTIHVQMTDGVKASTLYIQLTVTVSIYSLNSCCVYYKLGTLQVSLIQMRH